MDGSIIVTYRCPMRCKMCNIWDNPTLKSEEFKPEILEKLPQMSAVNITGGEPFVREDIEEIVKVLRINAVGDVNALREARLAKRAGLDTDTNCYVEDGVVNANVYVEGTDLEKVSRRAKLIKDRFVKMGYSAEVWIDEEENRCQTVNALIDLPIYLRKARKFVV